MKPTRVHQLHSTFYSITTSPLKFQQIAYSISLHSIHLASRLTTTENELLAQTWKQRTCPHRIVSIDIKLSDEQDAIARKPVRKLAFDSALQSRFNVASAF